MRCYFTTFRQKWLGPFDSRLPAYAQRGIYRTLPTGALVGKRNNNTKLGGTTSPRHAEIRSRKNIRNWCVPFITTCETRPVLYMI